MSSKWLYHSQRWYKQQLVVQRYYMNKDKHIPQGYKNSPLGIIPKEWEVKKIIDFAPLQRGFDLPTNKIIVGEYPVVYSNGILNYHNEYKAEGPGVVTGRSGTIGKVTYVESNYWPHNTSLWVTDFKGNNPKFVYYIYNHIELSRFASGSGVPTLNRNDVHVSKIAIPPTEEQGRIVNVLELWDTAIEKQSELIEKLTLRKRALMQQLLTGKKRLAGFNGKWKHVPIKTFAKEISNKNIGGDNHIVLSCTKYDGLVPSLEYFGKQIYSNDLSSYKIIPIGHFAYATNHIEEGSIGYQSRYEYGLISPMYTVFITDKTKVNDTFLFAVLKSHHLVYLYKSMMEGSINRRGGLRWNSFSTIKIDLPPLAEQNAIASVLVKADKEIELAKGKLASLQSQKRGLMQQLLTGKKRIK